MTPRLVLSALLLLLPFSAVAADAPRVVDLAAPEGATLTKGVVVDDACLAPILEGRLPPGGAVVLSVTPDCRVVPSLSCPPEDRSDACVDLRVRALPSAPDPAGAVDCVRSGHGCALLLPTADVSPELGGGGPKPWTNCANYARHAFVDTGETEVRVDMVWEAGCGPQAEGYYGLGQCLIKGVGPQPGGWVQDGCPHLHQWSGWEVAHEVTGNWHYVRSNGVQDGHHSNRAGVHGDNSGATWCEFTLQFNPHSNVLLAVCGYGPF